MPNPRELVDAVYRLSFASFVCRAFEAINPGRPLSLNWHIDHICDQLQQMVQGRIPNRLVINLPPRSLKSYIVSVCLVAWLLGRNLTLRIICASYSEDLSNKFSRDCRALMETKLYKRLFRTRLNPRKTTESEFETTQGGFRLATSVGGTLTGRGCDVLVIDDPTKSNEVNSELALQNAIDWFRNTAMSRLDQPSEGMIIVTQQRLHVNDLSGMLIERGWPALIIPAICTQVTDYVLANNEVYHRAIGEVLQADRISVEALNEIKNDVGSRIFAAQYQQDPAPMEGDLIKVE